MEYFQQTKPEIVQINENTETITFHLSKTLYAERTIKISQAFTFKFLLHFVSLKKNNNWT